MMSCSNNNILLDPGDVLHGLYVMLEDIHEPKTYRLNPAPSSHILIQIKGLKLLYFIIGSCNGVMSF